MPLIDYRPPASFQVFSLALVVFSLGIIYDFRFLVDDFLEPQFKHKLADMARPSSISEYLIRFVRLVTEPPIPTLKLNGLMTHTGGGGTQDLR